MSARRASSGSEVASMTGELVLALRRGTT